MLTDKENRKKLLYFFGFFIVFYAAFMIFSAVVKHMGYTYPIGDFRFFPHDRFKDYFTINQAVQDLNPYLSELSNYPPIILVFAYFFSKSGDLSGYDINSLQNAIFDPKMKAAFVLFFVLCATLFIGVCLFHAFMLNKEEEGMSLKDRLKRFALAGGISFTLLLSAPSIFLIDRGNYLAITVVFFMLWAVFEDRKSESVWGAIFAALCAATKIYPIYILLLYVFEKKFKKLIWAIITGAVVTIVPIFFFKGGYIENVQAFIKGVLGFGGGGIYSVYFTVGITGVAGYLFRAFGMIPSVRFIKLAWVVMGGFMTLVGLPFLCKEKKTWKKLLVITAMMVYLTPNSYLYNTTYMFGPIFVMLMSRDKSEKKDIPYYIISALLLVPKAYMYIDDLPGVIPLEFNTVNIAVVFDSLLYFALIMWYFAEKIAVLIKEDRKAVGTGSLTSLTLSKKRSTILNAAVCFGLFVAFVSVCLIVKDTVLACHDSIADFVQAKMEGPASGFKSAWEFGLARGRVGVVFPCVVYLRYLINAKGNFLAIWLMQYVPVFANVALLSYIIGKRLSKIHGFFFALFFLAFLQIDIWHNLITSYPLDFMYGLFIMIVGLMLYDSFLNGKQTKLKWLKLAGSVFLYYESLQVYESFIMSSLIYAILAFVYVKKNKKGIKDFVIKLLPHFITAVIYLGIMLYLRSHPVVDTPVSHIEKTSFKSFILPYGVFTMGMFPLTGIRIIDSIKNLFVYFSRKGVLIAFFCAIGLGSAASLLMARFRNMNLNERKEEYRKNIIFMAMGLAFALTFAIPHAMIPSYQEWVNVDHVGGYVPTTICYYAWCVALIPMASIFIYIASFRSKRFRILFLAGFTLVCYIAAFITFGINISYRNKNHVTGTETSLKAQNFYALIHDDYMLERKPRYIYSPDLIGIHFDLEADEEFAESVMGYDMEFINDQHAAIDATKETGDVVTYKYDFDAAVGMIVYNPDFTGSPKMWITYDPVYFFTTYDGTFDVFYKTYNGETKSQRVEVKDGQMVDFNEREPIFVNSIDLVRVS